MNVERLKRLAEIVEAEPLENLDIERWRHTNPCGTTYCFGGLAAADPEFNKEGLQAGKSGVPTLDVFGGVYLWGFHALAHFFGISGFDSGRLFDGREYNDPTDVAATTAEFLRRVNELIGRAA